MSLLNSLEVYEWQRHQFSTGLAGATRIPESVWAQGSFNSGGLYLIFSSSHLHILSSSHLLLLPSCPLALSFFSISLLKAGAGQCQRDGTKRNPFARNEVRSPKTEVKLQFARCPAHPFTTKWGSIVKNRGKSASWSRPAQPFRTKWGSIVKNWSKTAISRCPAHPFARNEVRSSKPEVKVRVQSRPAHPFARNEVRSSKTEVKLRCQVVPRNPFARNEVRSPKT